MLTLLVIACLALFVTVRAASANSARISLEARNYWDALAACETGGRWHQRGSFYVGGLGIWYGNWQKWAPAVGVNKPAYMATREEQIRVATYGRRVDGASTARGGGPGG